MKLSAINTVGIANHADFDCLPYNVFVFSFICNATYGISPFEISESYMESYFTWCSSLNA